MIHNKFERLQAKLRELSVKDHVDLRDATDVYYDLRISGSDMDDLLAWVSREFEVDFSTMRGRYAPGEADLIPGWARLLGRRPYKSMTVRDLVTAIERGSWQEKG